MILIIDNYDSFTYNLKQLAESLGAPVSVVRNDAIAVRQIPELTPERIILSPGPGAPDSAGITLDVIRKYSGRYPILGVCLGHQAIAQAFGGQVDLAPVPMHGKVSTITHVGRGVFQDVPPRIQVARYHSLMVRRESLPECLEVTATTQDGLIMGIQHREFQVHGVQFHPESIATEHGARLLSNFIKGKVN